MVANIEEIRAAIVAGSISLDNFRAAYRKMFGRDTKLDDDALTQMIANAKGDQSEEDWANTMKGLERSAKGQTAQSAVSIFAMKAKEDAEFQGILLGNAIAKEVVARSPVSACVRLTLIYGEDMAGFPIPDSKDGNNPDVYKEPIKGKDVTVRWFNRFVSALDVPHVMDEPQLIGQNIPSMTYDEIIDELDKALMNPAQSKVTFFNDNVAAVTLETWKKKYSGRRDAARTLVKKAVSIWQMMRQIENTHDKGKVRVRFMYDTHPDGKKTLSDTTSPIILDNPEEPEHFRQMKVSEFLNLDPAVSKAKGGNFDTLRNSGKKAPEKDGKGGGETDEKTAETMQLNINTFETAVAGLVHFLEETKNMRAVFYRLNTGKLSERKDLLLSIGSLYFQLDSIMSKDNVKKDYDQVALAENAENGPLAAARERKAAAADKSK